MAPKAKKMSLQEFAEITPGRVEYENLPTRSGTAVATGGGKGFRGKGMRGDSPSRADGDWGRGGGKGDDRGGKGKRRDEPESRADTGDWFSKDKPMGGGMDRDRGDRGGDRGDRGGMDRRGPPRDRDDNGAASQDNDWRGGSGRDSRPNDIDRRNSFRDRDRDDRGGDRGFGRRDDRDDNRGFGRRDDGPSERPRLQLKPRTVDGATKKDDEKPATTTESGARKYVPPSQRNAMKDEPKADERPERPWKKNSKADGDDNAEDDGFTAVGKKSGTAKPAYVPPSQRRQEPIKEEKDDSDSSDSAPQAKDDDKKSSSDSDSESEKEEKTKAAPKPASRRFEDEPPRKTNTEEKSEPADLSSLKKTASTGGKYVPPSQRKAEEERRKKEEEEEREREKAAEERKKKKEKDEEASKKAKQEADKKKELEKQEKREKEQKEREAKEAQKKQKLDEKKKTTASVEDLQQESQPVNEAKLSAFSEKCKEVVDANADVKKFVAEVPKLLSEIELRTIEPVKCLLEPLLRYCLQKEDKEVIKTVERFAPLFNCLIDQAQMRRYKVKLLREAQRVAYQMGLPRLSPASALLEAFFDGLYQAEVVEEQFFEIWSEDYKDDTPGRLEARFQLNDFLDWLQSAKVEGEESSEEENGEEKEENEEEEDSEDDIEANVPQRGRRPLR